MEKFFGPQGHVTQNWLGTHPVLVNSLFEEELIKIENASMETLFSHNKSMDNFFDAQGHVTPKPVILYGQNSNSSEILCLSLLLASLTKTRSKLKVLVWRHRGSYMSAHVLLNLLNKIGKKIRCKALLSILLVFPDEFNKFNNTGARMQSSIYQMTLKSHFICKIYTKMSQYRHQKMWRFYGCQHITLQRTMHI